MPRLGMIPRTKRVNIGIRGMRNNIRISKKFFIVLIPILIVTLFFTSMNMIKPTLIKLSESRAKSIGLKISNAVVSKYVKDIKDEGIINFQKDKDGKIIGYDANVLELNKMSVQVSSDIQTELMKMENSQVNIPMGAVVAPNTIFASLGPNIPVEVIPLGNVSSDFTTLFESTGINQSSHKIVLNITTKMSIVAPFVTQTFDVTNSILVSETVIMGDVPQTYYNLEGMNTKDSIDLMD